MRDYDELGNLAAAYPLQAQSDNLPPGRCRGWSIELVRLRQAICQTLHNLRSKPRHPLAHRPRTDVCRSRQSRLPAQDAANNRISIQRRGSRILVDVHLRVPYVACVSQHLCPTANPDGQPTESSQLGYPKSPSDPPSFRSGHAKTKVNQKTRNSVTF